MLVQFPAETVSEYKSVLKHFSRPKTTRSSLRRQKLLRCLDGGHYRHEDQDAGSVL